MRNASCLKQADSSKSVVYGQEYCCIKDSDDLHFELFPDY